METSVAMTSVKTEGILSCSKFINDRVGEVSTSHTVTAYVLT